jgi:hypothetical protein
MGKRALGLLSYTSGAECDCVHPEGGCSGRFTEWDEWRKNGVDLCE